MKLLISLMLFLLPLTAGAQCTYENRAFQSYENIRYNLYFNWKFIWLKAGTASMTTTSVTYKNEKAYKTSLITQTSSTIDKYFRMRDTLMVYFTPELTPLYYRKGAREGKRYYVDEMWYSYADGKCYTNQRNICADGEVLHSKHTYERCVSDMLNSFQRIRNLDPKGWKVGHTIHLDIAGGEKIQKAKLVYKGKKVIKADNDKKYNCLILSYVEPEGKKDNEVVRFYVTDDLKHIPVRLDLFLRFGSAKAFLSSAK